MGGADDLGAKYEGQVPVEQLIEQGLERYGVGDVDGALAAWELALARDPDDARAGAYVDYVRENYQLLQAAPRSGEDDVPFGLGAVAGNDDLGADDYTYDVEVTRGEFPSQVEQYIEAVDEGWFLDDELPPSRSGFANLGPVPRAHEHREAQDPPSRPSRQLPLPATPPEPVDLDLAAVEAPGITLELEADEPDSAEPLYQQGGGHHDDEQTGDFGGGAWAKAATAAEIDFADQRSAVPTQELRTRRGFVRPLDPVPPPTLGDPDGAEQEDDRLGTRPGGSAGIDAAGALDVRFTPDALGGMGGFDGGTDAGRAGPDELTRETSAKRLSFTPNPPRDSGDQAATDGDLGDDERTIERPSVRADTSTETTLERGGASYTIATPLDQPDGDSPGGYPPLVIIEDPVPGPSDRGDVEQAGRASHSFGDELSSPGTVRLRRPAVAPRTASTPSGVSTDELAAKLAAELEAAAPSDEARADRTRRRVTGLIDRGVAASGTDDHATAIVALDLALREDPESVVAQKLIHRHQPAILDVYRRYLGDLGNRPALAMPMHELAGEKLDIRAAFLLSRIDGTLSFEEILDVSGMQRPEAFRHLSILLLRGILEVR